MVPLQLSVLQLLLQVALHVHSSLATYRILALSEACHQQRPEATQVVLEDGGAAIIYLSEAETKLPHFRCDLEVKVGSSFGLMVQVEAASLRPSELRPGKCQDFLQMGIDDKVPFWTLQKTKELCGEVRGTTYDVPNGQLLVWVQLGGSVGLSNVSLSLVVTSYIREHQSQSLTNYRACAQGGRFIRRGYFCDGRINCASDPADGPADELPTSCGISGSSRPSSSPPLSGPPLNLLTVTLVLVSGAVVLISLAVVAVRLGRRSGGCCRHGSALPAPELPDRPAPCLRIPRSPPRARPHTLLHETSHTANHAPSPPSPPRGTTPDSDSDPLPAYSDLFPPGYSFEEKEECVSSRQGGAEGLHQPNPLGGLSMAYSAAKD